MATSGARLQLAIAPAGAGKTTAMRALAAAWTEDGGTVIGLAPSAAAAAVLREQTGASTDTLAKLTWSIDARRPARLGRADRPDDAGRRSTRPGWPTPSPWTPPSHFVTARGGQVRLIGDNQQLAAIGAGGVLRDIAATHGALHLSELMRFADPAEGAASLALRDGRPEALGFYLDHDRVHVGDLATVTDDVVHRLGARPSRTGLDSIMLAPTRDLVSQLNQHAQAHRLAGTTPGPEVPLADGNTATSGTRSSPATTTAACASARTTGSRTATGGPSSQVHPDGSLTVRHARTSRHVTLPADYVAGVDRARVRQHHPRRPRHLRRHHARPGHRHRVPPAALHDAHPRRAANHLYLQVVGDGDPHTVIRPENVHPPTATDLLQGILARDDAPTSATTLLRDQATPPPGSDAPPPTSTPSTSPPSTTSAPASPVLDSRPTVVPGHRRTRLAHPARPPHPARRHRRTPYPPADRRRRPRARHRRRPRRRPRLAPPRARTY